jgi:hypothetical protein
MRWLVVYVTCWKVAGSSPDEVIEFLFNLPNPSSRNMAICLDCLDNVGGPTSHNTVRLHSLLQE